MRHGPSRTSSLVAFQRALADGGIGELPDFADPTALPLLPAGWRLAARALIRLGAGRPEAFRRYVERAQDLVPLRTRVIDGAWHDAQAGGIRQLVLLGAGLDGRAFRLDDLGDSSVFEVDHPATQAHKRARAAALAGRARRHAFVPVDFEREGLEGPLARAGHDAGRPTCWIWEGVTPYLTRAAQEATLSGIAARSSEGSRLVIEYIEPVRTAALAGTRVLVRLFGEPFVGMIFRDEMAARLRAHAFELVEDTGPSEWRRRSGLPDRGLAPLPERIAVAVAVAGTAPLRNAGASA